MVQSSTQPEIAKVNRKTGVLYLSDDIWNRLPSAEKDFVLLHEEGHLKLQTADEFRANQYAIGKFLSSGTFSNKQFGQKIMVMRSALDKADGVVSSNFTAELGGSASGIMQTLSVLGVGSKSRQNEAKANAAAAVQVYDAEAKAAAKKAKSTQTIILIVSALALVGLITFFVLRKR